MAEILGRAWFCAPRVGSCRTTFAPDFKLKEPRRRQGAGPSFGENPVGLERGLSFRGRLDCCRWGLCPILHIPPPAGPPHRRAIGTDFGFLLSKKPPPQAEFPPRQRRGGSSARGGVLKREWKSKPVPIARRCVLSNKFNPSQTQLKLNSSSTQSLLHLNSINSNSTSTQLKLKLTRNRIVQVKVTHRDGN